MTKKRFYISDTHFGHANSLTFPAAYNEGLMRGDTFTTNGHMNHEMIKRWNSVVGPNDRVYHMGDVAINRKYLPIMKYLNGKKVLIKGNHDIFKLRDYLPYFEDIRSYAVNPKDGFVVSHVPLHPSSFGRFGFNVHGHLHDRVVMLNDRDITTETPDLRYLNLSVEQPHMNYTPIEHEQLIELLRQRTN